MPDGTATAHLYRPKLATTLSEGYRPDQFRKDATAALTVAIVALPLSMPIAVASGVSPDRGLYTAIVGGFLVSALSGSRFQIGGPAGAFIVLVAATAAKFGVEGLLLTVFLSGVMLTLVGLLRLGSLIRHIPHAVTVGFTCGIAVTIFASQLKDLGGFRLTAIEPGPLIPVGGPRCGTSHARLRGAGNRAGIGSTDFSFEALSAQLAGHADCCRCSVHNRASIAFSCRNNREPVRRVATRFAHAAPADHHACAVVAGLAGRFLFYSPWWRGEFAVGEGGGHHDPGSKHRSNMELIAQGVANIGSALFGGICVTGTIARTATNVRAGARTPISGMMHSAFLLLFMIVAAPLAGFVPLAALAGVLVVVCWNMSERKEFRHLLHDWPSAAVLIVTFALTLFQSLTVGIVAGCALAALFAVLRRRLPE